MNLPCSTAFACFLGLCLSGLGAPPSTRAYEGPLGDFEGHTDVGSPRILGSATYNAVSEEYSLSAGGVNMWAQRDEFQFVWKKMKGDFVVRAHVRFLGQGVDPHRKLGWIARQNLEPDAPYADATLHGDGLTSLQFRRTKGAITEQIEMPIRGADVIQLEKKGDTYTFSAARFGDPFVSRQTNNIVLGEDVYVGLFLCSHNPGVLERAVFSNVRIIRPAPDGFTPYRDYIGSNLEILDVNTGARKLLYQSPMPFEAPNWTPDGGALIYNSSGRTDARGKLFRFDLLTRQATLIDTGFASRNNNDHVISFDGTMLGISHHSTNHMGRSAVFTVPIAGGTPKLITRLAPSYFHGWSPDGQFLVYTGGRNDEYDIYRMPASGEGDEIKLTDYKGLDDGPEYSPDGKYIYFNSTRSGTMQIWRMSPDGKNPEQITRDDFNNWFPHISPDGTKIAILSFSKDVDPTDHPYYKHVYIRVLPIEGGTPKVVAYVYGGQGTINVPSWSPDSQMLAFVSNTAMP